jgi:TRAP-type C4-dicarboxylate transport system permease small subunit
MRSVKSFFVQAGKIYIKSIEWTSAVLIVLVSLAMLETVFSRTILHLPLSAIDRINISLMIWICFLFNDPDPGEQAYSINIRPKS